MGVRSRIPLNKEYLQRMNKQIESQQIDHVRFKEDQDHKTNPTTTLMTTIHEQLRYYPKTKQNRELYQQLLNLVNSILQDQSQQMLKSVVDEVIFCIKNELSIKELFQELTEDQEMDVIQIVQQISDYIQEEQEDDQVRDNQENIQEEIRVGVNFDSEQEEDDYRYQVQEGTHFQAHQYHHDEDTNHHTSIKYISNFDFEEKGIQGNREQIIEILDKNQNLENELMELFNYENVDLIKQIIANRENILQSESQQQPQQQSNGNNKQQINENKQYEQEKRQLDLENLQQDIQQQYLLKNDRCKLPQGSYKVTEKGYEEIHIPAVQKQIDRNEKLIKMGELEKWQQNVFKNTKEFNRIQSKVYECGMKKDENMLVCSPTGSGKTFIALMTILNIIGKYRDEKGNIDKEQFKIVYIAPMKALVSEIVMNLNRYLEEMGLKIREMTGDMGLSRKELKNSQIIVCTPEKYDIISRKNGDQMVIQDVKLIIIDEIHLLHDQRGPVLEAIVARTLRQQEQFQEYIRIVGLSATLPNYKDIAMFLRVDLKSGLFYFDASYRPIPLEQQFIGITEKKGIKKMMIMNNILYKKVIERAAKTQTIIFVHSRKDTIKTAQYLKEQAYMNDELQLFVKPESASQTILASESNNINNNQLKQLLQVGIGIHHAGLSRLDRQTVEDLFNERHVKVLVSTATLAWGVNLPAHTVIIKGTQIYSPQCGKWTELSNQDMLQMIGRAGRPRLDTKGEGIIITGFQELKYYLSMLNEQLSIESQMISQMVDQVNAEIQMGNINNLKEGVEWLGYTYLYIRMLRNPGLYNIGQEEYQNDRLLVKRRIDLIHTALIQLDKLGLVSYDRKTSSIQATALSRIASHYYLKHQSIQIYNQHLKIHNSLIDIFRIFSLSSEFQHLSIREEEKVELLKLSESLPIPVKSSLMDPQSKINMLLQCYISKLSLNAYAINSDMNYVQQSGCRIVRGLFEISVQKRWASLSEYLLNLAKMIDNQMWSCMSPLRQFKQIPQEILRRIEKKEQFNWEHFYQMSPQQLGDLVKFNKLGKVLHRYIHSLPRLELKAFVQPVTRQTLKIDIQVKQQFLWDNSIHGSQQQFWLFIEDCDGQYLLYSQQFIMKNEKGQQENETIFEVFVPLYDPLHPVYYIKVNSDKWLGSQTILPISFKNLILPNKLHPNTELVDQPLFVIEKIDNQMLKYVLEKLDVQQFNQIQSQIWKHYYYSTQSVFLGCSYGNGRSILMVLGIISFYKTNRNTNKVLVICSSDYKKKRIFEKLERINQFINKKIKQLSGDLQLDIKLMEESDIIVSSCEHIDQLSRRWRNRKSIQQIGLVLIEGLETINSNHCVLEVVASRFRYIQQQLEQGIRFLVFAQGIGNYKDMAEWMGIDPEYTFNFAPNISQNQLSIQYRVHNEPNRKTRIQSITKNIFLQMSRHLNDHQQIVVFTSDRQETRILGLQLSSLMVSMQNESQTENQEIKDMNTRHVLGFKIGLLYEGQDSLDAQIVRKMYDDRDSVKVLIVSSKMFNQIENSFKAELVIVQDLQTFDFSENRYSDYSLNMIQLMCSFSVKDVIINLEECKVWYYKKQMQMQLIMESELNHYLIEHLNSEIVAKTIENKQDAIDWITWTFMYRRLSQNPNFYNLYNISGQHINDYLSELIENTVSQLESNDMIMVQDDYELIGLNPAIIASYYYIPTSYIHYFQQQFNNQSQPMNIYSMLSVLAYSLQHLVFIRAQEQALLSLLNGQNRYSIVQNNSNDNYSSSIGNNNEDSQDQQQQQSISYSNKINKIIILLQCHLDRSGLNNDLQYDLGILLQNVIPNLHSMIDIISSIGVLKQAIIAMQISQMIIQAMWNNDGQLKQLPFIEQQHVDQFKQKGVEDIVDFMNMEDDLRQQVLKDLDDKCLYKIAQVCNRYPQIEIQYKLYQSEQYADQQHTYEQNEDICMEIQLTRDQDDDDYTDFVYSPYFPKDKQENWWVIVGNNHANQLLAIKKVSFRSSHSLVLHFSLDQVADDLELIVYLICDSYIGADQAHKFKLNIVPQQQQDSHQEEEEDDEQIDEQIDEQMDEQIDEQQ